MKSLLKLLSKIWLTLAIAFLAVGVALAPSSASWLQFDRTEVATGELWRLATCHVTHWNGEHLAWDLLMFVVLGAVCELRDPRRMRSCVVGAAAAVSAMVCLCFPGIETYRGLSGIDTALFVFLAVGIVRDGTQEDNRGLTLAAGGLLVGFAAKTMYEAVTGQTFFVDQSQAGFVPLVWDHIVAGCVGAVAAFCPMRLRAVRGVGLAFPMPSWTRREYP
jgi:rhomboid family GlyGly-CTERM serine protease